MLHGVTFNATLLWQRWVIHATSSQAPSRLSRLKAEIVLGTSLCYTRRFLKQHCARNQLRQQIALKVDDECDTRNNCNKFGQQCCRYLNCFQIPANVVTTKCCVKNRLERHVTRRQSSTPKKIVPCLFVFGKLVIWLARQGRSNFR